MDWNHDEIIWIDPNDILNHWDSHDGGAVYNDKNITMTLQKWHRLLDIKRGLRSHHLHEPDIDQQDYLNCLTSIRQFGFIQPLQYYVKNGRRVHGDGHHRFTAAIDLGYKRIPYVKRKSVVVFQTHQPILDLNK